MQFFYSLIATKPGHTELAYATNDRDHAMTIEYHLRNRGYHVTLTDHTKG